MFYKKAHEDRQDKVIVDIVPNDIPLRSTEEDLEIFQSSNGIYYTAQLKPAVCLVADATM